MWKQRIKETMKYIKFTKGAMNGYRIDLAVTKQAYIIIYIYI